MVCFAVLGGMCGAEVCLRSYWYLERIVLPEERLAQELGLIKMKGGTVFISPFTLNGIHEFMFDTDNDGKCNEWGLYFRQEQQTECAVKMRDEDGDGTVDSLDVLLGPRDYQCVLSYSPKEQRFSFTPGNFVFSPNRYRYVYSGLNRAGLEQILMPAHGEGDTSQEQHDKALDTENREPVSP